MELSLSKSFQYQDVESLCIGLLYLPTSHAVSCPQNNARLSYITELFWEKDRFQKASENAENSLCMSASWDIVFEFRIVWYPRLNDFDFLFFLLSLRKLCSLEESWVGPAFCWIWVSHISGWDAFSQAAHVPFQAHGVWTHRFSRGAETISPMPTFGKPWHDCLTVSIRSPGWLCHNQVAGLWRADKKPAPLSSITAPLPSHAVALDIRSICSHGEEQSECLSEAALVVPLMSQHQFCCTAVGWGKRSQAVPDFDHPN